MPEGPELHINSRFVNHVCRGRLFRGKAVKSAVSKCCDIDFSSEAYSISSEVRGKEMALTLQCSVDPLNRLRLVFRFGMSGRFRFAPASDLPKHAHLQFFSYGKAGSGGEPNVLCFVDVRRFGTWRVMPAGWGEDRGPDPMLEYDAFRCRILESVEDPVFNKPICEVMLNQKYFNGIGNYLRAEILFRAKVPPFTCARNVLEPPCSQRDEQGKKKEDFLWLCHKVPLEVVELKQKLGRAESMAVTQEDYLAFCQWLQCYEKPGMRNLKDHNARTVWFKGEAGPLTPKIQRSRKRKGSGQAPGQITITSKETSKEGTGMESEGAVVVKGEPEVVEGAMGAVTGKEEQRKETGAEKPVKQQRKRRRKSPPAAAEQEETVEPSQKKPRASAKKDAQPVENPASPFNSCPPTNPGTRPKTRRTQPSPTVLPTRRSTRIKNARQKV